MHEEFYSGNTQGRDHLGDLGVDGSIILKCILKKCYLGMWIYSSGS
jgi:hypothetical protein